MQTIFSIGHSNIPFESFFALLQKHQIEVIADVRSHPFSKYSTQFNFDELPKRLKSAGVKYVYLGSELGGMPKERHLYDEDGDLDHIKVRRSERFKSGLLRLQQGAGRYTIALMCGEEDPTNCHRRNLIGPALADAGIDLKHIRNTGEVMTEQDFRVKNDTRTAIQLGLFDRFTS